MSSDPEHVDTPRWTLPPRREISPDNLHISAFIVAKRGATGGGYSVLLLRAGEKHPLTFRRGKLLLPATFLRYGENPREAARRLLKEQLQEAELLKDPQFLAIQSYLGAHWDIVFLFETSLNREDAEIHPKDPYVHAAFYDLKALPRDEIAGDHLDVIDEMLNPSNGV